MERKPFGVATRETREKLFNVLNESGLPIDAIDMLLGEMKMGIHAQAEQEYQEYLVKKQGQITAETNNEDAK